MTYVIGLTGGIGSGKTTAASIFEKLGVPIIDADQIAHALTQKNTSLYQIIITHFGEQILQKDLSLNRPKLREIIFENTTEKKWLENLLHPAIRAEIKKAIKVITAPYCICVIPLLKKTPDYAFINRILVIESSLEAQRTRVETRDKSNPALIQKIIAAQATADDRRAMADDLLENDGDVATLIQKIDKLHQQYLQLSQ